MDAEFSRAMLNRACDRLESTSRWSSIFVLILLFFHITSFQPYINLNQLVSYTQMQIVRLEQLEPVVTKLSNALNTINDQKKQIETDYQTTLNGLVTGFQNLNNMVGILQSASEVTLQSTEVGPPQSSAGNLRATDQAGLTQPPPDTSLSSKLPAITDRSSRSDQLPGSMLNPMQSQMPLQSPLTSFRDAHFGSSAVKNNSPDTRSQDITANSPALHKRNNHRTKL
ncbi:MAG: hypothetical protein WC856_20705 [Methylococcaceae bacterium]|jgi:hypothetical protein